MLLETIQFCLALHALDYARAEVACEHMHSVVKESKENSIKPEILLGLIYTESRWNSEAVSPSGACGLTQVLPKYSKKYGGKDRNLTCDELKDPATSIQVGAKMLNYWYYKYGKKRYKIGLCGYNAGFRCKGDNPNKTGMYYASKVIQRSKIIKRKSLKFKKMAKAVESFKKMTVILTKYYLL